jgi:RsiW-degrading membrane proteinase PrsW (M82 family)
MGLLALAVAPGIAICLYIYLKDRYNKEPRKLLIFCFLLGMLSIIPAIIIEVPLMKFVEPLMKNSALYTALATYGIVAVSEEGSKFLVLRFYAYPKKAFDDPFDGIVYAVIIGMGFATLENIGYVLSQGWVVGVFRLFLSVPGHATFAVLMGYNVGFAKFNPEKKNWYFFLALFWSIAFHGTFDFFLMAGKTGLHVLGAVISLIVALRLSFIAIKKKQEISRTYFIKTVEA